MNLSCLTRELMLDCIAHSPLRFTPGRAYVQHHGGFDVPRAGRGHYIDVFDDQDRPQRFTTHPRVRVRNEHAFVLCWRIFRKPEVLAEIDRARAEALRLAEVSAGGSVERQAGVGEVETVLGYINAKGCLRPFLVVRRPERWRAKLHDLVRTEVFKITSARAYSAAVLRGTPPGIYVTHLWQMFVTPQGNPSPIVVENHDFFYRSAHA